MALPKPATNVYTVMLAISFVALLIACIMLWLELSSYGPIPQWNVPSF